MGKLPVRGPPRRGGLPCCRRATRGGELSGAPTSRHCPALALLSRTRALPYQGGAAPEAGCHHLVREISLVVYPCSRVWAFREPRRREAARLGRPGEDDRAGPR